jgi:valyl-tRNA synthetase
VDNAPEQVVARERERLRDHGAAITKLEEQLATIREMA